MSAELMDSLKDMATSQLGNLDANSLLEKGKSMLGFGGSDEESESEEPAEEESEAPEEEETEEEEPEETDEEPEEEAEEEPAEEESEDEN